MTNELERQDWELAEQDQYLSGFWLDLGSRMEKDATWQRILWLIAERLEKVADANPERSLYRDPRDGRCWELIRSRPELPDGGPLVLKVIEKGQVGDDYGVEI